MNVCLIETEKHFEVINNIFNSIDFNKYSITVITNTFCISFLQNSVCYNVINYEIEINKTYFFLDSFKGSIITITPPSLHHIKLFRKYANSSALILHNINFWLNPWKNIFWFQKDTNNNIKELLRFIKYFPQIIFWRNKILNSYTAKLCIGRNLFQTNKSLGLLNYLGLTTNEIKNDIADRDFISIVSTGSAFHEREYDSIINTLIEICSEKNITIKYTIVGKYKSSINKKSKYFELTTFDKMIKQDKYDFYLKNSDFVVIPIIRNKSYRGILELKGRTNISGSVYDCYRFAIPFLIPAFYDLEDDYLGEHFKDYNSLKRKILDWILNKNYQTKKNDFLKQTSKIKAKNYQHNSKVLEQIKHD